MEGERWARTGNRAGCRRLTERKLPRAYLGHRTVVNIRFDGLGEWIDPMASMSQRANEQDLRHPAIAAGYPDRDDERRLIDAMINLLGHAGASSDAEALKFLRNRFPDSPLPTRIAAFAARFKFGPDEPYRPR
jgi:hypothetical protein